MNVSHRYRRTRRGYYPGNSGTGTVLLVLLIAVILAGVIAFSPFGEKAVSEVLVPAARFVKDLLLPKDETTVPAVAQITPVPTAEPTTIPTQKETLILTANPFYILQMGQYDNENDGQIVSAQNQSMGGAGYLFERDGVYRLFAAAYTDAESLKSVQQQIRKDGFVNEAYITDAKSVRVTLEGVPEAIDTFRNAESVFASVPMRLCELTLRYDMQKASKSDVASEVRKWIMEIDASLESLHSIASDDIDILRAGLEQYKTALSEFSAGEESYSDTYYAGALKHLQLQTIDSYLQFFEE